MLRHWSYSKTRRQNIATNVSLPKKRRKATKNALRSDGIQIPSGILLENGLWQLRVAGRKCTQHCSHCVIKTMYAIPVKCIRSSGNHSGYLPINLSVRRSFDAKCTKRHVFRTITKQNERVKTLTSRARSFTIHWHSARTIIITNAIGPGLTL